MIVADSNLLLYLVIPGPMTMPAERVLMKDKDWVAPDLILHEVLNALCTHVRAGLMTQPAALDALRVAQQNVRLWDGPIDPAAILDLSVASGCSGYDCEFVALAKSLNVPLVTSDSKLLKAFPGTAVSMDDFLRT